MTKTIEMIAPATLAVKIRDNKSEVKLVAKSSPSITDKEDQDQC